MSTNRSRKINDLTLSLEPVHRTRRFSCSLTSTVASLKSVRLNESFIVWISTSCYWYSFRRCYCSSQPKRQKAERGKVRENRKMCRLLNGICLPWLYAVRQRLSISRKLMNIPITHIHTHFYRSSKNLFEISNYPLWRVKPIVQLYCRHYLFAVCISLS